MALDAEMRAMQVLSKLDDETRDSVLTWAARKWPARTTATEMQVRVNSEPKTVTVLGPGSASSGELPLVRKGG